MGKTLADSISEGIKGKRFVTKGVRSQYFTLENMQTSHGQISFVATFYDAETNKQLSRYTSYFDLKDIEEYTPEQSQEQNNSSEQRSSKCTTEENPLSRFKLCTEKNP